MVVEGRTSLFFSPVVHLQQAPVTTSTPHYNNAHTLRVSLHVVVCTVHRILYNFQGKLGTQHTERMRTHFPRAGAEIFPRTQTRTSRPFLPMHSATLHANGKRAETPVVAGTTFAILPALPPHPPECYARCRTVPNRFVSPPS